MAESRRIWLAALSVVGAGLLISGIIATLLADWLDYAITAMPSSIAAGLAPSADGGGLARTAAMASPLRLLLAGILGSLLAGAATALVLSNRQRRWHGAQEAEARQRADEERLSRQHLDLILTCTNAGTWEWNVQTGETRFNERWAEIVGCTLAELEPTTFETWARLTHPGDLGATNLLLKQHLAGESEYLDFKARIRHKDGRWVWVHDRGRVATWTPDGKPEWMFGTHVDITAEQVLARRLAESQDLLERGGEIARLGGWRFDVAASFPDPSSTPIAWTATTYRIHEVPEGFEPTAINSLNFYTDESRPVITALIKHAIDSGEGWECDLKLRTWNGRIIWVRVLGEAELDDDGTVIALYGVVQDIDAQRRIEEDLRRAKAEADDANAAKSRFLANTSHEIRTPLNALMGLTYLLDKTELDPDQRDLLAKIEFAGSSLAAVINDVLDLSKVESGEMTLEELPLNFGAMTAAVVAVMGSTADERGIELQCNLAPDLPPLVLGDITRLRQILTNLLSNALKFTERGGHVSVSLSAVGVVDGATRHRLSVKDTGIGIPDEALTRLFTPFTQADTSTTRTHGGTGLGLSIVHRLTEMMSGVVTVTSAPGIGSEFRVDLPLRVPGDDAPLAPRLASDPIRVWVATPDDSERRDLAALCRSLGWQTDQANSGNALVQSLRASATTGHLPHVLVMRWRMGDHDAATILHDARLAVGASSLPAVVLLSDQEESFTELQPYSALAARVLRVPIDASQLFDAVSEAAARNVSTHETRESGSHDLRGLTVAVADDSELNLLVARRILELHGATVLADTGGQAVLDRLRTSESSIDALLLDIQMPEIDGNEVARRIRSELNLTDLPIIALTADALVTEREEAFAAGMNAFLSKPFDPAVLVRTILEVVASKPTTDGPPVGLSEPDPPAPPDETSGVWPQIHGIDDPDAIREILDGDVDTFLHLLNGLLAEHDPDTFRAIAAEGNTVDRDAVARRLHKLRGGSAALGATGIAAFAGELEVRIRTEDLPDADLRCTLIQVADLLEALRQDLPTHGSSPAANPAVNGTPEARTQPRSVDAGQLDRLRQLLEEHDLAAEACLAEFSDQLRAALGEPDYDALRSAIQGLQFDRAIRVIDQYLAATNDWQGVYRDDQSS